MAAVRPSDGTERCIRCGSETTTGMAFYGEAEFIVLSLRQTLGVLNEKGTAIMQDFAAAKLGCAPGETPDGKFGLPVHLCARCGEKVGQRVGELTPGGNLPALIQDGAKLKNLREGPLDDALRLLGGWNAN